MEITPLQQELIDECMDNFRFNRVDSVMGLLGWRWALCDDVHSDTKTPTEQALRVRARQMLKLALENGSCVTGGFDCRWDSSEEVLSLKFVLEDWEAYRD